MAVGFSFLKRNKDQFVFRILWWTLETFQFSGPTSENLRKTSLQLWVNLRSPRKTSDIFLFSHCKVHVKMNIGSSKSIWGYGFDGRGGGFKVKVSIGSSNSIWGYRFDGRGGSWVEQVLLSLEVNLWITWWLNYCVHETKCNQWH